MGELSRYEAVKPAVIVQRILKLSYNNSSGAMANTSMSQRLDFTTYDVFTQTRFQGNPLAIIKVPKDIHLPQDLKQAIAREFNFSETVFLHEAEDNGSPDRRIDIFTTTAELPFAGHPTIGCICCVGGSADNTANDRLELDIKTKAGSIQSTYDRLRQWAVASIPHSVHIHQSRLTNSSVQSLCPSVGTRQPDDLLDLWPHGSDGSLSEFPVVSIVKGMTFILISLPNVEDYLQKLQVGRQMRYAEAIALDEAWTPSFAAPYFYTILSEGKGQPTKIRARMIEPQMGEDPATGSAACTLGCYLALQAGEGGRSYRFEIVQGVEMGRESKIGVEITLADSAKEVEQVLLSGTAVKITEGTLLL